MAIFGVRQKDEYETRRVEQAYLEKYAKKLDQYARTLDLYNKEIRKYGCKFEEDQEKAHDDQMYNVGVALDLKYLKEQGDQVTKCLMQISDSQLNELQTHMGEHGDIIKEMQQLLNGQLEQNDRLQRKLGRTSVFVRILFIGQLITIAGLGVMILHSMGVITF